MKIPNQHMLNALPKHKLASLAASLVLAVSSLLPTTASAVDLGIEGQVYEPLEEDFRLAVMRLIAAHDWAPDFEELEQGFRDYTKNLPPRFLPTAEKTLTRWKDVGINVAEDIYLPWVDYETGSVFEPESVLAVKKGTYLNPISHLPAAAIERLFIFDATHEPQLALAKELMRANIPGLSFMLIAGDLGPLSEEMQRPIYYPTVDMFEKFNIRAAPTLLGFGRGPHNGHMAITEFSLPTSVEEVKSAWFGLGDASYDEYAASAAASGGAALQPSLTGFSAVGGNGLTRE